MVGPRGLGAVGAAATALLAAGLAAGRPGVVPWALAGLGGGYAAALVVSGQAVDTGAVAFAAGLLLTAELAYWSLERRLVVHEDVTAAYRRAAVTIAAVLGAAVAAAVVLAVAGAEMGGGVGAHAVGVAAAVLALAAVVVLARGAARG